jgi:hypothetical protein
MKRTDREWSDRAWQRLAIALVVFVALLLILDIAAMGWLAWHVWQPPKG